MEGIVNMLAPRATMRLAMGGAGQANRLADLGDALSGDRRRASYRGRVPVEVRGHPEPVDHVPLDQESRAAHVDTKVAHADEAVVHAQNRASLVRTPRAYPHGARERRLPRGMAIHT